MQRENAYRAQKNMQTYFCNNLAAITYAKRGTMVTLIIFSAAFASAVFCCMLVAS